MPICREGSKTELICPQCGKRAVTVLNGGCYQCCGSRGGCGFVSLKESDFRKDGVVLFQ